MGQKTKAFRGYSVLRGRIPGLLSAHAVSATLPLPADGGAGIFWVFKPPVALCFADWRLIRRIPGSSGTTTVGIHRLRAGVWTALASLTITGVGVFTESLVSVAGTDVLATTIAGDVIVARLETIEAGAAEDLTVQMETR
jgi:hypothetical protein